MLKIIEKDIEYSNKIINDLLEYSREMKLQLHEATPKSILMEALTSLKVPRNVRVIDRTQEKLKIHVDKEKMQRVFVNIIKNAIDAMPKGGTLTVTNRTSNGSLEITFSDTGAGMSKETLEKIWRPLFTTKAKGMGFGLAICKRIVEAHGGKLSVKSTVGKGSDFTVSIPMKTP
jgi:signal transduction histidine kinase